MTQKEKLGERYGGGGSGGGSRRAGRRWAGLKHRVTAHATRLLVCSGAQRLSHSVHQETRATRQDGLLSFKQI